MTMNADDKELKKFDAKLWMPPVGVEPDPESPWAPEAETSSFHAFKAAVTRK